MHISHSHKFIFVHIPKTAGMSMIRAIDDIVTKGFDNRYRRILRKLGVRQDRRKAHFRVHDPIIKAQQAFGAQDLSTFTIFAVVRNPFDHAVSHYEYLKTYHSRKVADFVSNAGFEDYLRYRLKRPIDSMPAFLRLRDQTSFLVDRRQRILATDILRFENLNADFTRLMAKLGLPERTLPRVNVNSSRTERLIGYYASGEAAELVRRLYRRDFKNFGYSENYEEAQAGRTPSLKID